MTNLLFKSTLTLAVSLILINLSHANDLQLGKPVPEINGKLLSSNEQVSLAPYRGKVIILNFWATWCAPCLKEMPAIQAIYSKYHEQGLEVISINMDDLKDISKVRNFIKPYSLQFAHKSEINYKGLGRIWRLPSTFVIDRQGLLRKDGNVGDPEVSFDFLDSLLMPLLNEP
jgi:cytochrome c biogenesis protein CcmG, thiol:disulfide interchange protein DsbE